MFSSIEEKTIEEKSTLQRRWSSPPLNELAKSKGPAADSGYYAVGHNGGALTYPSPSLRQAYVGHHKVIEVAAWITNKATPYMRGPRPCHNPTFILPDVAQLHARHKELPEMCSSSCDQWGQATPQQSSPQQSLQDNTDGLDQEFSEYQLPSQQQLYEACGLELLDEDGKSVRFGELYPDWPELQPTPHGTTTAPVAAQSSGELRQQKTVVFFIRLLACGQCQDYMAASVGRLNPDAIAAHGVRVIIISNGSWRGIKRYRQIMKCPFPMYVDPTLDLYRLLGMSPPIGALERLAGIFTGPKDKPSYHQHPTFVQTLLGVKNASQMGIINIGSVKQTGGEFILLPGYKCEYAHRMPNKFSHDLAVDVLQKAGVNFPERSCPFGPVSNSDNYTEQELVRLQQQDHTVMQWRRQLGSTVDFSPEQPCLNDVGHEQGSDLQSTTSQPFSHWLRQRLTFI